MFFEQNHQIETGKKKPSKRSLRIFFEVGEENSTKGREKSKLPPNHPPDGA